MKKKGRWQVEIGETIKTEKSHKAQASFLIIVIIINPWVLSLFHQSGNYSSLPFLLKSSQEHQQQHYHHRDCYCGGAALGNIQIVYQSTQAPSNSALISRRDVALASVSIPLGFLLFPTASEARERRNRRVIPSEDYTTTADGLKYYDLIVGKGVEAEKNSTVQVHFDCIYRGVTALSSRESKLLAGNRIIAQAPCLEKSGNATLSTMPMVFFLHRLRQNHLPPYTLSLRVCELGARGE
ncbi:hypothetical protein ZOSMA_198G00020 [Zostera marina]|uniref:Uncharacterized protein n=1 Tax=Zostera marina TaxID=29655 RepID=A0A0K9PQX2_ZOSMR|nr:hypothetical protein ZOSMA_198G00020 [Zostera marina]